MTAVGPKSREEVLEELKPFAVEVLGAKAADVIEDATLKGDLDADSLDLAEFAMALEEHFGITIDQDKLEDIKTVGDAVDLILQLLSAVPEL